MIRLFRVVILSLAVASSASPSLAQSTDQLGKGLESLEQGDFKQGFQLIQSVAESGDKEAQFTLAALYVDGNAEMPKNLNEGLRLYKLAAGQGFAPAQNELGVMFLEGRGVAVNEVEGVQWIRRAAEQGYPTAETNLSKSYAHGRGVATDDAEALRWMQRAADQGYAPAQYEMGVRYQRGNGVTKDFAEAMRLYRLSAAQDKPGAKYNIGVMYLMGEGVAVDAVEATRWFKLAAEQGFADAQFNLAVMYFQHRNDDSNLIEAYKWATLASNNGDSGATELLKSIRLYMTDAELAQGQLLVKTWTPPSQPSESDVIKKQIDYLRDVLKRF